MRMIMMIIMRMIVGMIMRMIVGMMMVIQVAWLASDLPSTGSPW